MTTRAHRRPVRALAVLAAAAPLVGTLVVGTATPAAAAQSVKLALDSVGDGDVLTSAKSVTATGTVTNTGSTSGGATLTLTGPSNADGNEFHSTTGISGCSVPFGSSSCTRSASAVFSGSQMTARRNGKWTASVSGSGGTVTRTFWTKLGPTAEPANLAAAGTGRSRIDLSWSYAGTELDKAGFTVTETGPDGSRTHAVPMSACDGSSCSLSITDYDNPAPGTYEYSFVVTALRSSGGCPGCGDTVASGPSNSATAQVVTPEPPPSPTPTPSPSSGGTTGGTTGSTTGNQGGTTGGTTGGSTTGTTGGTTTGGSAGTSTGGSSGGSSTGTKAKPIAIPTLPPVVASRRAFALGFNSFSPSLNIPKLPPLPATTFPVTAPSSDTYQPTLPYQAESGKSTSVLSAPVSVITETLGMDGRKLAKLMALGALLLVVAAHVRFALASTSQD